MAQFKAIYTAIIRRVLRLQSDLESTLPRLI